MRHGRALALITTLCFLAGLLTIPTGPQLVCRMTGQPMEAMSAAVDASTCCSVAEETTPDGASRYHLTSPGCCDLKPGIEKADPPAVTPTTPHAPVAALLTIPVAVPVPVQAEAFLPTPVHSASAPRAPPGRSASPRAPPFFS